MDNLTAVNSPAQVIQEKQETFSVLYQSVYKDLYRFAYYCLKSSHDAEDVVSEAVIDAYSSFHKLRDKEKFKPWIFKILSVKCKRKFKEYGRKKAEIVKDEPVAEGTDIEGSIDLYNAFHLLQSEERLLVMMSVFVGYTSVETGDIMKMNPNTVRSKLSRAYGKIRKELA